MSLKIYQTEQITNRGEKLVFEALSEILDEQIANLFSFGVANWAKYGNEQECDFILVGRAGIFVIEVKGGNITVENGAYVQSGRKMDKSPLKQASDNYWSLTKILESNGIDKHASRLGGYICVFPETYWDYNADAPNKDIILDQFFSHDLGKNLKKVIGHYRDVARSKGWMQTPLREEEITKIQSILVGTTKQVSDLRQSIDINAHKYLELSLEQYDRYQEISDNDRIIIKGPPGSGKTLLAFQILKERELSGQRTFFVCKNKALAVYLRAKLVGELGAAIKYSKIQHIDEFAREVCGKDLETTADYSEIVRRATEIVKGSETKFETFPYLLIDEGQDILQEEYCDLLDSVLESGLARGKWCLLMDPNQDMFVKTQEDVFDVYFNNNATVKKLTKNYRNTEQIQKAASVMSGTDAILTNGVRGESPEIKIYENESQSSIITNDIQRLLESGVLPSEITILSFVGKKFSVADKGLIKLKNGIRLVHINDKDWVSDNKNEIVYASVYEFKGLDNDIILFTDINDIDSRGVSKIRHLVGATRARNHFIMYVTHKVMQRLLDHENGDLLSKIDPAYSKL